LIALRRSAEATRLVRRKQAQRASKQQKPVSAKSYAAAKYFMVWTSLPATTPANEILEAYRCRWQIELSFKRMKSILGLGHLPKKDPASARAWLHGKLLTSLLVERIIQAASSFSPWGYRVDSVAVPLARS
jgi:IS4 transposase